MEDTQNTSQTTPLEDAILAMLDGWIIQPETKNEGKALHLSLKNIVKLFAHESTFQLPAPADVKKDAVVPDSAQYWYNASLKAETLGDREFCAREAYKHIVGALYAVRATLSTLEAEKEAMQQKWVAAVAQSQRLALRLGMWADSPALTLLVALSAEVDSSYKQARADYIAAGGDPQSSASAPESAKPFRSAWLAHETAMRTISVLEDELKALPIKAKPACQGCPTDCKKGGKNG